MEQRVIITGAQPDRLKIIKFLLNLAGWQVTDCDQIIDAINVIKNAEQNDRYYAALVVSDYLLIAPDSKERLEKWQYLQICTNMSSSPNIVIFDDNISAQEKQQLAQHAPFDFNFCRADNLLKQLEEITTGCDYQVSPMQYSDHQGEREQGL